MEERKHKKVHTRGQYTASQHEILMYFYRTTCYRGCWNGAKGARGGSLKSAVCRPANWRPAVARGCQLKGCQPACRRWQLVTRRCECGQNEDSARHLLLEYPNWEAERRILRPKIGARWGDLSHMLGGWNSWKDRRGKTLDGPKEKWRPSVSIVKAVIKFIMATKKLTHTSESETEGSV